MYDVAVYHSDKAVEKLVVVSRMRRKYNDLFSSRRGALCSDSNFIDNDDAESYDAQHVTLFETIFHRGPGWVRTTDASLFRGTLYQLSYWSMRCISCRTRTG